MRPRGKAPGWGAARSSLKFDDAVRPSSAGPCRPVSFALPGDAGCPVWRASRAGIGCDRPAQQSAAATFPNAFMWVTPLALRRASKAKVRGGASRKRHAERRGCTGGRAPPRLKAFSAQRAFDRDRGAASVPTTACLPATVASRWCRGRLRCVAGQKKLSKTMLSGAACATWPRRVQALAASPWPPARRGAAHRYGRTDRPLHPRVRRPASVRPCRCDRTGPRFPDGSAPGADAGFACRLKTGPDPARRRHLRPSAARAIALVQVTRRLDQGSSLWCAVATARSASAARMRDEGARAPSAGSEKELR